MPPHRPLPPPKPIVSVLVQYIENTYFGSNPLFHRKGLLNGDLFTRENRHLATLTKVKECGRQDLSMVGILMPCTDARVFRVGFFPERYRHGGPGVCLGDGRTEAEGVPSQGGRGDALLRRMPLYT